MAIKKYDLAVKTGEYQDRDGNTKGRYENIGAIMENDNGQFMMIKRTFSPAGVPTDRDNILVSMFDPKPRDNHQGNGQQGNQGGYVGGYDDGSGGY